MKRALICVTVCAMLLCGCNKKQTVIQEAPAPQEPIKDYTTVVVDDPKKQETNYLSNAVSDFIEYDNQDIPIEEFSTRIQNILKNPNMSVLVDTLSKTSKVSWNSIEYTTKPEINNNVVNFGKPLSSFYFDTLTSRFYGTIMDKEKANNKGDLAALKEYDHLHSYLIYSDDSNGIVGIIFIAVPKGA